MTGKSPDYRETVEKLRTTASYVCATPVQDIQHDADGCCLECRDEPRAHVMRDALTLLTAQADELATLRAENEKLLLALSAVEKLRRISQEPTS